MINETKNTFTNEWCFDKGCEKSPSVWNVPPFCTALPKQRNLVLRASRLPSILLAFNSVRFTSFFIIVNVFQIWSTLVGYEELAVGFEQIRKEEILWKNKNWFMSKTTALQVHLSFQYKFWRPLHDNDVKLSNGGGEHMTTNLPFSL